MSIWTSEIILQGAGLTFNLDRRGRDSFLLKPSIHINRGEKNIHTLKFCVRMQESLLDR